MNRNNFIEQTANAARRAYQFSVKSRKEGLAGLEDDIDTEALKRGDVFEFGMRFALEGAGFEQVDGILSGMIGREKNEYAMRLKTIQKEAVICIQRGDYLFILLNIIFSFLNDDEKKEARVLLEKDSVFKEYFNFY